MVSVIIVSYNSREFILDCISSIRKFSPKDTEIIIVDNASTDNSVKLIKENNAKAFLIENSENLGYAKAVNKGIKKSRGEFILVLNPDTKITKSSVENLIKFMGENKNVGLVGSRLLNPDGSLQPSCYNDQNILNAIKQYFFGVKGAFQKYYPDTDRPAEVSAVVGAAMFFRKATAQNVGLFSEKYFMYFEDLDFCREIKRYGLSVYYLPTSVIYHEHGGITRTVPEKAKRWLIESSIVYHGRIGHSLLTLTLWLGQKFRLLIG